MSSLLVGRGPTTPDRHETSVRDAVRVRRYTHTGYEFKAFVIAGQEIPKIGRPARMSDTALVRRSDIGLRPLIWSDLHRIALCALSAPVRERA